ncbi:hypothetical protein IAT40_001121 [Kwoniella sp. CBS 6097]
MLLRSSISISISSAPSLWTPVSSISTSLPFASARPGPSSFSTRHAAAAAAAAPRSRNQTQGQRTFTSSAIRSARTHGSLSHYDALKLSRNATKQQIKAKFYELSKLYHPDAKGGDTAKFHEINDAYAVLGDDSKRRQYDLSITPASQAHHHGPHSHSHSYRHGPGSHSSFSPNDPYLHRAAQGPHRAWSASSASQRASQGQNPRTEHYSPFGRRTPPNFQYTYEYNFQYNPNARRTSGAGSGGAGGAGAGRRKAGTGEGEEGDGDHIGSGGGGMWKFVVTVGLILVVISLGGGLTANSQSREDWQEIITDKNPGVTHDRTITDQDEYEDEPNERPGSGSDELKKENRHIESMDIQGEPSHSVDR